MEVVLCCSIQGTACCSVGEGWLGGLTCLPEMNRQINKKGNRFVTYAGRSGCHVKGETAIHNTHHVVASNTADRVEMEIIMGLGIALPATTATGVSVVTGVAQG